jgi:uncharacterized protein with HEPN domain
MKRIAEYIHGFSFSQFKRDYKNIDAGIRNSEVIEVASKNLSKKF